jgi:hypothetical protein
MHDDWLLLGLWRAHSWLRRLHWALFWLYFPLILGIWYWRLRADWFVYYNLLLLVSQLLLLGLLLLQGLVRHWFHRSRGGLTPGSGSARSTRHFRAV